MSIAKEKEITASTAASLPWLGNLKPIEVSERALRKINIWDKFDVMRHLYTSTSDNMYIYNNRQATVLLRSKDKFNDICPVLRIRNLFGSFQISTKVAVDILPYNQ